MIRLFLFAVFSFIFSFSTLAQTKRVLIEEGTGTWCQWCPRGNVFSDQMTQDYDAIPIAIHRNDDMEIPGTVSYFAMTNITGLPNGNIDRTQLFIDPLNWGIATDLQSNISPAADIEVTTEFDSITRSIAISITATMYSNLNGDYRLGAVVLEDAVTGPAPSYNQSNAYAGGGNGPMGGYELLASSIPASEVAYDHVARQLVSEYQGDPNSLPTELNNSNQYTHNLSWELPIEQDQQYVYVVAYMTNATTGEIINANKSAYLMGNTNAKPKFLSQPLVYATPTNLYQYDVLCHDPDNESVTITIASGPDWLSINQNSDNKATISGMPINTGVYQVVLSATDGENNSLQSFELEVIQNNGDWIFVGDEAFTSTENVTIDIAIDSNNTVYLAYTNKADKMIIQKFENETWSVLGNVINGNSYTSAIEIDKDNNPIVATIDNNIAKVYQWKNEIWQQLGENLGSSSGDIDIAVANDGTIYVAYKNNNDDSKGFCKKWNGNNWTIVGETNFNVLIESLAIWPRIVTDSQNNPIVIYATSESGYGPYFSRVSSFDGQSWNILGEGNIDTIGSAYNHSIAIDNNDKLYISSTIGYQDHILNVYTFNQDEWQKIGSNVANEAVYYNNISVNSNGNIAVIYENEGNGKTTVSGYDGENWVYIGLPLFTNHSAGHAIAYSNEDIPYIAYIDELQNEKISVKKYSFNSGNPSNINTNTNNQNAIIYPNPNNGNFTLEAKEFFTYNIIDIHGRVLIKDKKIKNKTEVKLENLKSGVYFIELKGNSKKETIQFLRY